MLGKKTKNKKPVVVTTKGELKAAIKSKKSNIEVQGDLARKMKWMTKLNRAAFVALVPVLITSSLAFGGATAGLAVPAAVSAAGITGEDILLCTLSVGIIIAIVKGYDIEADAKGIVHLTKNM